MIKDKFPDLLVPNLRLVFVGTAASHRSAAEGAYYAHPGNRFWRALHEVGLTPRLYAPSEFRDLLNLGIGFTDMSKRGSGRLRMVASARLLVAVQPPSQASSSAKPRISRILRVLFWATVGEKSPLSAKM